MHWTGPGFFRCWGSSWCVGSLGSFLTRRGGCLHPHPRPLKCPRQTKPWWVVPKLHRTDLGLVPRLSDGQFPTYTLRCECRTSASNQAWICAVGAFASKATKRTGKWKWMTLESRHSYCKMTQTWRLVFLSLTVAHLCHKKPPKDRHQSKGPSKMIVPTSVSTLAQSWCSQL